jgi:multimeric flavodoxin WrbA
MREVPRKIGEADGLILGFPIYRGYLSGQMKAFMDRVTVLSGGHPDFAFVREHMDRAGDELDFFSLASGGARVADIRAPASSPRY